jgi:phosphate starvation-inducible PhoH-like protein
LLEHYQRFGKVSLEDVRDYLDQDFSAVKSKKQDETLIYGVGGNPIKPRTNNQKLLVEAAAQNDIVFAVGPAGTGKTYTAVAVAVRALKNKQVKKIVITRPAVEAGENLGFLPGDMREKIDPYLRPVYDAFEDMIPSEKLKYYQEKNIIEIAPIAFMRGRTLSDAFILLDEAQNTTVMQIKMFLTRLGQNSKMIITGDISQIDLPRKVESGLVNAVKVLKGVEGISFIWLDGQDVVRHKLVKSIISAYDRYEEGSAM